MRSSARCSSSSTTTRTGRMTEDADLKLAVFSTGPAIRSPAWNLVSEIIGTFVLVFVIFAFAATAERDRSRRPRRPARGVRSSSSSAWPSAGRPATRSIPARDLGPRIAHFLLPIPGKRDSDWGYSLDPGRRSAHRCGARVLRLHVRLHELHARRPDLIQKRPALPAAQPQREKGDDDGARRPGISLAANKRTGGLPWRTTSAPSTRGPPVPGS